MKHLVVNYREHTLEDPYLNLGDKFSNQNQKIMLHSYMAMLFSISLYTFTYFSSQSLSLILHHTHFICSRKEINMVIVLIRIG